MRQLNLYSTISELPSVKSLPPIAKSELAAMMYPGEVYDCELPQLWVDDCLQKGFDPRSVVVWLYPVGNVIGEPAPLTIEAEQALQQINQ